MAWLDSVDGAGQNPPRWGGPGEGGFPGPWLESPPASREPSPPRRRPIPGQIIPRDRIPGPPEGDPPAGPPREEGDPPSRPKGPPSTPGSHSRLSAAEEERPRYAREKKTVLAVRGSSSSSSSALPGKPLPAAEPARVEPLSGRPPIFPDLPVADHDGHQSESDQQRIATLERQIERLSGHIKLLTSISKDQTARIERLESRASDES